MVLDWLLCWACVPAATNTQLESDPGQPNSSSHSSPPTRIFRESRLLTLENHPYSSLTAPVAESCNCDGVNHRHHNARHLSRPAPAVGPRLPEPVVCDCRHGKVSRKLVIILTPLVIFFPRQSVRAGSGFLYISFRPVAANFYPSPAPTATASASPSPTSPRRAPAS